MRAFKAKKFMPKEIRKKASADAADMRGEFLQLKMKLRGVNLQKIKRKICHHKLCQKPAASHEREFHKGDF